MPWTDPPFGAWIFVISEWAIRLVMLVVIPLPGCGQANTGSL
jgi:hypothetical protein